MKEEQDFIDKIEADWIIVEVVDKNTGITYRRNLPVRYLETDNGVILSGETLDGKPSHINFLSAAALAKIRDLIGQGPDHDRCGSKEGADHVS
ncbi:hypothetical protein [Sporomusa acidovorans]|uniref:Uncharacterized protein n=1 Tax=Sporomusa acidovorans (strain ATCC 49682 / DSM 3132 / Mol) TaxID=1123286 RepID=A0ABZ3J0P7_SPOA4|nr:hypothetical protein [Sporomusa acidovorans]OZC22288.1 hypothetical protein SPACI_14960 [Sporomusa acidovorans DSM 3132]SDF35800.1 hypothetical protein SAMN04488499_104525 [Sporomusa acidovorans]